MLRSRLAQQFCTTLAAQSGRPLVLWPVKEQLTFSFEEHELIFYLKK
jgi:hypothetical protein